MCRHGGAAEGGGVSGRRGAMPGAPRSGSPRYCGIKTSCMLWPCYDHAVVMLCSPALCTTAPQRRRGWPPAPCKGSGSQQRGSQLRPEERMHARKSAGRMRSCSVACGGPAPQTNHTAHLTSSTQCAMVHLRPRGQNPASGGSSRRRHSRATQRWMGSAEAQERVVVSSRPDTHAKAAREAHRASRCPGA